MGGPGCLENSFSDGLAAGQGRLGSQFYSGGVGRNTAFGLRSFKRASNCPSLDAAKKAWTAARSWAATASGPGGAPRTRAPGPARQLADGGR